MKRVVSYALFGENTRYAQFLPAVLRAHHALFSKSQGWELRIHLDDNALGTKYGAVLESLAREGLVELRWMRMAPLCRAMMWRLAPLWDDEVEVTFCRDIDALPTPRDRTCMEAFMASPAWVHTIHDNQMHDGIMGGLSGFKRKAKLAASSLEALCSLAGRVDWAKHGTDQDVLNRFFQLPLFEHYFLAPRNQRTVVARAPVPPNGEDPRDALVAHLGASGFDVERAVQHYRTEAMLRSDDFPRIETLISQAEKP